jgi:hypothetical protein
MPPKGHHNVTRDWDRVCREMDEAHERFCRAAKPIVAEREAESEGLLRGPVSQDSLRAFIAASDAWALTVAAVNAFALKHLRNA